jgi:hypothetical protein
MFEVISSSIKDFFVSVIVKHISMGLVIRFINVYGSSYDDQKYLFILELHSHFVDYQGHSVIGEILI